MHTYVEVKVQGYSDCQASLFCMQRLRVVVVEVGGGGLLDDLCSILSYGSLAGPLGVTLNNPALPAGLY